METLVGFSPETRAALARWIAYAERRP